ncbi:MULTISPECIES: hypothetical protein [unclassified Rhizobium]|uniref:hypothetical protein n=1 Tax=unclassified Rhizobium TaxID=2613769 RepID=UPI001359DFED|nr:MULTISPECIES: hypothetical protein [unclassified Rhizobium]
MDENLVAVVDRLVVRNHVMGNQILALQAVCAAAFAEICLLQRDPRLAALRTSAMLGGTAQAIADGFSSMPSVGDFDTSEITQMLEKIADISEKTVLDRDINRHLSSGADTNVS